MKVQYSLAFILCGSLTIGSPAKAQDADPATATLLNGTSAPAADDLDSSRFTVAPTEPHKKPTSTKIQAPEPASASAPTPVPTPRPSPVPSPSPSPSPTPVSANAKPSIPEQVKVLILGDDEQIEGFHKQTHPDDRRNNSVDLSIAPSYFYNSSSSNYSFRRFTSEAPAVDVGADIWASPFCGLHADYFTSMDAAISATGSAESVDYQDFDFGMRFRKVFGATRKATSLSWGLDYFVDSMSAASNATNLVSTTTSGLSLSLEADMPTSVTYTHILGIEIRPRLVHSESSPLGVRSGQSVDTDAVGAWMGGEWIFDRHNQIYWKVKETVEQNSFQGPATVVDPTTGATPNGVSVTNSMTIFSIGYKWGN